MKKLLRNKLLGAACLLLLPLGAGAQVQLDSVGRDAKYVNNIIARSQKIVDALQLTDKSSKQNVLHIICNRYFLLNDIYEKFGRIRLSVMRNSISTTLNLLPIWKTISQRSR